VHRLLGEERENCRADVAAPGAAAVAESAAKPASRPVAVASATATGPVAGHEEDVRAALVAAAPSFGNSDRSHLRSFLSCSITIYRNRIARQTRQSFWRMTT
jgi:predicted lipid-binding transport protein (Tim44 family)